MREKLADLLAEFSALLLTWSNDVRLRDRKRGRHEQGVI